MLICTGLLMSGSCSPLPLVTFLTSAVALSGSVRRRLMRRISSSEVPNLCNSLSLTMSICHLSSVCSKSVVRTRRDFGLSESDGLPVSGLSCCEESGIWLPQPGSRQTEENDGISSRINHDICRVFGFILGEFAQSGLKRLEVWPSGLDIEG